MGKSLGGVGAPRTKIGALRGDGGNLVVGPFRIEQPQKPHLLYIFLK
jgi:hypothetical protein